MTSQFCCLEYIKIAKEVQWHNLFTTITISVRKTHHKIQDIPLISIFPGPLLKSASTKHFPFIHCFLAHLYQIKIFFEELFHGQLPHCHVRVDVNTQGALVMCAFQNLPCYSRTIQITFNPRICLFRSFQSTSPGLSVHT